MEVKIKKLVPEAVIPKYAHDTDAGMDLTAVSINYDKYGCVTAGTGLAMEIPKGYVGYLFPRSSIYKTCYSMANSIGVIDAGFRGEVMFKFRELQSGIESYNVGDRIGQIIIMPYPKIKFKEVEELNSSDRGEFGFGSSGK